MQILRNLIKNLVTRAVQSDIIWSMLDSTIVRVSNYAIAKRNEVVQTGNGKTLTTKQAIELIAPDLTVQHGPFQGMAYPTGKAVGSALLPKLLGSYERELHPILEQIGSTQYSEIVDIGCAEGYYAIGLAMKIPTATVYAYDTNREAISLCKQMAQLNGVNERLVTGDFCDPVVLQTLPFTQRGLIISDCEGYEKTLFTPEVVASLARHDVLIEVHDFADIEISPLLRKRFEPTHALTTIQSVDDIAKAHVYQYDELRDYNLESRKKMLAEGRPAIMEWYFWTPRADL